MKKLKYLLILIILLVPFFVCAEGEESEKIIIKAITIKEQSETAEEKNKASVINNQIHLDLKFKEAGDYMTYNIFLQNTSDEDYALSTDKFVINSDHIEYQIESPDLIVKAQEGKIIQLKVNYKNAVSEDSFENGSFQEDKAINLRLLTDEQITNPNTGRSHTIFSIICIVAGCIIIWKNTREKNNTKSVATVLIISMMLPIAVNAAYQYNMEIHSSVTIEKDEKICIIEGKGTCTSRLEGEHIKKRELSKEEFNIYTENVMDSNETPLDFIKIEDLENKKETKESLISSKVDRMNILPSDKGCYVFSTFETC